MEEKIKDVLDAYTFQTTRVCRGRGAFICDTDQGMKIVKAYHRSPQRLEFEQLVKYTIRDRGYYYVDQLLPNKEGQYLNSNKDGQMYTVRDWFEGRECDVKNAADVLAAVRQLAVLHMLTFSYNSIFVDGSFLLFSKYSVQIDRLENFWKK